MNHNQTAPVSDVPPLHQHGANVDQKDMRLERVHHALRGISALAYSVTEPDEALYGRRGDLSSLLDILCEELEYTITGKRPLL